MGRSQVDGLKKLREAALALQKAHIDLVNGSDIYENIPVMLITYKVDDGAIIKANENFLKYLGYELSDIVGKQFLDLVAGDKQETIKAFDDYKDNVVKELFFKNYYKTKDGSKKPMYWVRGEKSEAVNDDYDIGYALPRIDCYYGD
jgi:PAS domain S-box-containing protein